MMSQADMDILQWIYVYVMSPPINPWAVNHAFCQGDTWKQIATDSHRVTKKVRHTALII